MAYREFRNEVYYEAPEIDGLPMTLRAIQDLNQRKAADKAAKAVADKKREEEFKNITFEDPEPIDKEYVQKTALGPFLEKMTKHKLGGGKATDDVMVQEQKRISGMIAKTKTDAAILNQGKELVAQMPDWINKGDQTAIMKEMYAGQGRNVENRDVSGLLDAVDPRKNAKLFNQMGFVQKALETMKAQKYSHKSSKESGSHDGAATTQEDFSLSTIAGIQYDPATKKYRIDPARKAAVIGEIFNHGGDLGGQTWRSLLEKETEAELDAEVQRYVASQKAAKGIDLNPEEVKQEFMLDASKNPYAGGKTIAQRVMDKAEAKILTQAQIDHQYDYTKSYDQINEGSGSGDKKETIQINPTFHKGQAKSANNQNMNYGGVGITFRTAKGTKDLVLTIKAPTTYTVNGGRKDNQKLERSFKTNALQLMPMTKGGNMGFINVEDPDALVKHIQNMTDEGILKYQPEMQLFFRGQVSDKFNTAGDAEDEMYTPGERLTREARNTKKAGISTAISHEFVPADENMLGQLKTAGVSTEQLNTPDMQRVQQAWRERYQKAANKNQKPAQATATKKDNATTKDKPKDPLGIL